MQKVYPLGRFMAKTLNFNPLLLVWPLRLVTETSKLIWLLRSTTWVLRFNSEDHFRPTHNPVVKLIIQDRNVSLKHAGVQTTSDLRECSGIFKDAIDHISFACLRQVPTANFTTIQGRSCTSNPKIARNKRKLLRSRVLISRCHFTTITIHRVRKANKWIPLPPWIPRKRMVQTLSP